MSAEFRTPCDHLQGVFGNVPPQSEEAILKSEKYQMEQVQKPHKVCTTLQRVYLHMPELDSAVNLVTSRLREAFLNSYPERPIIHCELKSWGYSWTRPEIILYRTKNPPASCDVKSEAFKIIVRDFRSTKSPGKMYMKNWKEQVKPLGYTFELLM